MTVQITIIGLGQVGTSIGLALAAHKDQVTRFGNDIEASIAQKALKLGAIDKIHYNLPSAVAEADIVLLALPLDQIHKTLGIIAQDVKADAVVMDTAPAKSVVASWAGELLPEKRHYVGLTPVFSPLYLHEQALGSEAAHPDLFEKGLMAISAPSGTPGEALKLAADLATLLGAQPYFVDLAEADGMMAAAHLLPQLSAAALVETLTGQPGWPDIRKVTGRPFAAATDAAIFQDSAAALGEASLCNRENVVRLLDALIASLASLRADIAQGDGNDLTKRLEAAHAGQRKWWIERSAADWTAVERGGTAMPTSGILKQQLGFLGKLFEPKSKDENLNREGAKNAKGH
jgi:prephenate dehydrogenase